ncbi:MAG: hypothetical protein K0Q49_251 [Haloplasmataceae bacterium]|jgi:hypothetical protein|nr:hypothetical protein [Haloplasmataceae bacterium]
MNSIIKLTFKDIILFILISYLFIFYYYTYNLYENNLLVNIFGVVLLINLLPSFIDNLFKILHQFIGRIINLYNLFNNDIFTYILLMSGFITFIIGIIFYSIILLFISILLIIIGTHF